MVHVFDTSVLVAALSRGHEGHDVARSRLDTALGPDVELAISTHALAETYATLTVLDVRPRITPGQAQHLLKENVTGPGTVIPLDGSDYSIE